MKKNTWIILGFLLYVIGVQAQEFTVTYAVQEGDTHPSGDVVSVASNGTEVATLTFGEADGTETFQAGRLQRRSQALRA